MGRVTTFEIILDGCKRGYFHPGEEIKGHLLLSVHGCTKIGRISVLLKGEAFCGWVEKQGQIRQTFRKKIDLLKQEVTLCDNSSENQDSPASCIRSGAHSYPFTVTLPRTLPTNFKSRIGTIRYFIKATLDRPWRTSLKRKLPFTVVEVLDTKNPRKYMGTSDESSKEIDVCHTHDNSISLEATIDKLIYRPGEAIVVKSECNNKSSKNMRIIKAKLVKVKEYSASKTYTERRTIAKVHGPAVPKQKLFSWETHVLMVPRTPASILSCRIIRLSYCVEVTVVVPFGYDLRVRLPVVIRNVPLRGNHAFPILHGAHLGKHPLVVAMDRLLRPKRARRYDRLSFTADSLYNLETGHEELEDEDTVDDSYKDDDTSETCLNSFQKLTSETSTDGEVSPQSVPNGHGLKNGQSCAGGRMQYAVW